MKLFFVCKQFHMRRDFIGDRYGRLWHLPAELARRGHEVSGFATSYRRAHAGGVAERPGHGTLSWQAHRLKPASPLSWLRWYRQWQSDARGRRADAIVASSDALQLWVGRSMARSMGTPLVVDFCDNYESFGASAVPGATTLIRQAARAAAATMFVSDPLREELIDRYALRAPTLTVENAVDDVFSTPPKRVMARRDLGLPDRARLIGTAGALDASRNVGAVYGAFMQLAATDPELHLVLAGELREAPPAHPRVIALGTLAPGRMPAFWSALNVAVVGLRDDAFGRYCYPLKLAEIMAVRTPVVFPRIGVFARADADSIGVAAETNDAAGLAVALRRQLDQPRQPLQPARTWSAQAERVEELLHAVLCSMPAQGADSGAAGPRGDR